MFDTNGKDKKIKNSRGFSLIELMVVVGILSLIVIGLVTFFTGGARSWISGQNQLKAQREARMAMDSMVKEIREGKSVLSVSYESGIAISFPTVLDKEDVTFKLIGNNIMRNNTNILISNIPDRGLNFYYFDDKGDPVSPAQASKLRINLQVDVDADDRADIEIETEVNLRNYGIGG